jgi:hypothetical protein
LDVTQPADEFFLSSAAVTDTYSMYNQVLLCVRAMPLIGEDKRDEGMKTVISALQLARHFDRNPLVISYRGSVDIRASAIEVANLAMQTGPVSQETRDALDAELAVQDRLEAYTWAVSTQRALFMDEFRSIRGNNVWFIARAYWNQQQSDCLDALQFHLELSRDTAPYRQVKQKIDDSPTQAWGQGSSTLPDIELAQRAVTRFRAKVRALRLINALQSHVSSDNQGPVDLAELGLPAEATTDPFTGEPMHVRKLADGWLVYAVGENFRDDGGNLRQNRDIGIGPPDRPGRFADL